ncbi:MAG: RNB domain-containing ribonuclease [Deltaproteobacteria bacterium]|nr:RNB domain-containing ribonuclease [Deltaproteobacteria bacterium]
MATKLDREQVLVWFSSEPERTFHLAELLERAPDHPGKLKSLKAILTILLREGQVDRMGGQRFRRASDERPLRGTIEVDRSGVASFVVEGTGDLISLSPKSARWLGHGDHVEARLVRQRGGVVVAEVGAVISDPLVREIGVFRLIGPAAFIESEPRRGRGFVGPPAIVETLPDPCPSDGFLVEYRIVAARSPTRAAVAEVTRVLGAPGDRPTEILRLFLEHELPEKFPEAVESETRLLDEPSDAEKSARVDLRDLPLVTIDGETARDFDDAVCASPHPRGVRVHVAIADVAYYVRRGTELDREAAKRGTSTYLTDRVVPMLPEKLSNSLCSLVPHRDRLCFVSEFLVDEDGKISGSKMYRAVMRSRARLTYTRVAEALEGRPDEEIKPIAPMLDVLADAAEALYRRRIARGAVDLDLAEPVIELDERGSPVGSKPRERNRAHRLIEDLMLAANMAIATHFAEKDLPTLFRIHDRPDPDKVVAFVNLANELGFEVGQELFSRGESRAAAKPSPRRGSSRTPARAPKPGRLKINPRDVARLARELSEREGSALHGQLLRCMAQARYDVDNDGHFGLAAERYLHFTSPIRRYPDLMVHRLLAESLGDASATARAGAERPKPYSREELAAIADTSSRAERRAMAAERACLELDRAYVAALHVGRTLEGRITGVQAFGLFVVTKAPFLEGLVPIATIGNDFFLPSEHGSCLYGQRSGHRFALGDSISVEIAHVDFLKRQVEFRLLDPDVAGSNPPAPKRRRAPILPRVSKTHGPRSGPRARPTPQPKRSGRR